MRSKDSTPRRCLGMHKCHVIRVRFQSLSVYSNIYAMNQPGRDAVETGNLAGLQLYMCHEEKGRGGWGGDGERRGREGGREGERERDSRLGRSQPDMTTDN